MKPEPIQTKFDGYLFRSRLEARWAVFFKYLNLAYSYEPEGFKLKAGFYLPDFLLMDLKYWIEIKPYGIEWPDDPRYFELAEKTDSLLFVLAGQPGDSGPHVYDSDYIGYLFGKYGDNGHIWCDCPECGSLEIQHEGRIERNKHADSCSGRYDRHTPTSPRLIRAYNAARRERFGVHE